MTNKSIRILILCEGLEEELYIRKLLSFHGIFSNAYEFCEPINCKSITKIFPRYQNLFTRNLYDLIIIFCDADKNSDQFQKLCSDINQQMFGGVDVSSKIVFFGNPVTLQIVLSHIADVNLVSSSKSTNQPIVEELTGISCYQGHEDQINEMLKRVKYSSYATMKERISKLPSDLKTTPSTNFYELLSNLESDDTSWIEEINTLINGDVSDE